MKPISRTLHPVALFTLAALFSWVVAGQSRVEAGFCQGKREGIRLYVEYLGRSIEKNILDSFFKLELFSDVLGNLSINFALENLQLQARANLLELLRKAVDGKNERQPTYEEIRKSLQPFWNNAAEILRTFYQAEVDPRTDLDRILKDIVIHWASCRSLASRSLTPCDLLSDFDPRLKKSCRSDLAYMAVLYGGNCKGDLANQAAKIFGLSLDKLQSACRILADRQASKCKEFGDHEYLCRALCNNDEQSCRMENLTAAQQKDCMCNLQEFRAINKIETHAELEKHCSPRKQFFVRALLGKEDCVLSTMAKYDVLGR